MSDVVLPSPADRFRAVRGLLILLALLCAGGGSVALFIDLPAAKVFQSDELPGDLRRLLDFPEVAAHGLGVACLIVGIAALDPSLWRRETGPWWVPSAALVQFVGVTYCGGLIVNVLKTLIIRVRPRALDLSTIESVRDTFGQAAAAAAGASGSDLMSFPSGHSAVAAGFAVALASRYPRGTWYFATVAIGAMLQRLVSLAHYPSDVLFGAGVGLLGAALFLRARGS